MVKRVVFFSLVFVILFFSILEVSADTPEFSPEYIRCLDSSYGWMPNPASYPEYYDRNYPGHNAVVLHRKHVYCDGGELYPLAMRGLEEQYVVLFTERQNYCNYLCRDRYYEQCISDGSFDTYYLEWCEDENGSFIEIPDYDTYWEPFGYNCYSNVDCDLGYSCVGGYCVAGDNGTLECTSSFACEEGEVCDEGICIAATGPACNSIYDCGGYLACVNGHCIGMECVYDSQCDSGNCVQGSCVLGEAPAVGGSGGGGGEVQAIPVEVQPPTVSDEAPVEEKVVSVKEVMISEGCEDSDGGLNYYLKSTLKDGDGRVYPDYTDYCLEGDSKDVLLEYSCEFVDGKKVMVKENHFCLDGCSEGACIKGKKECKGCFTEEGCFFVGYRDSGLFCAATGEFEFQVNDEGVCQNNFECGSNLCLAGECVNQGLLKKLLDWFKGIF